LRRTRRSRVEAFKWLGANEPLTKAVNQNYIGEETNAKLVSAQNQIALGTTVNTLSAKADSFLEHAYPSGPRCAPLAHSGPSTLKNIQSGVFVPIHHKSASASVHPHRCMRTAKVLGTFEPHAEQSWLVHLNYFTTGPFFKPCA
jgi:hypothetical protein